MIPTYFVLARATIAKSRLNPVTTTMYGSMKKDKRSSEQAHLTAASIALGLWALSGDVGDDEFAQVAYL